MADVAPGACIWRELPFEIADKAAAACTTGGHQLASPPSKTRPGGFVPEWYAPVARKLRREAAKKDAMEICDLFQGLEYKDTDPFLTWFQVPRRFHNPGGMPGWRSHPQSGFSEIQYCKEMTSDATPDLCMLRLRDHTGWTGMLDPGAVQSSQSSSGIEHEAIVDRSWSGHFHYFELWSNLPAKCKADPPIFQRASADELPPIWLNVSPRVTMKPLVDDVLHPESPIFEQSVIGEFKGMDHVDVPFAAARNPPDFTVDVWVKILNKPFTQCSPVTSRDGATQSGWALYGMHERWTFTIGTGAGWSTIEGCVAKPGEWVRLTASYKKLGREQRFYIDGELQGILLTDFSPNQKCPLRLGGGATERYPPWYFFTGDIRDLRIYNKALIPAEVDGVSSPVRSPHVPLQYVDFEAESGGFISHRVPVSFTRRFVYVYRGGGYFGSPNPGTASSLPVSAQVGDLLIIGNGDKLRVRAGNGGIGFLFLAGQPLNEPMVRQGNFVMSNKEQIRQCFADCYSGKPYAQSP